jgi:hypothetical protein
VDGFFFVCGECHHPAFSAARRSGPSLRKEGFVLVDALRPLFLQERGAQQFRFMHEKTCPPKLELTCAVGSEGGKGEASARGSMSRIGEVH